MAGLESCLAQPHEPLLIKADLVMNTMEYPICQQQDQHESLGWKHSLGTISGPQADHYEPFLYGRGCVPSGIHNYDKYRFSSPT